MDNEQILALYDAEMRIDPPLEQGTLQKMPGLTVFVAEPHSPRGGWVLYTDLNDETVDDKIQDIIDFFDGQGRSFEWKVFDHDRPASLKEHLLAHGFTPEEREALAVLDIEEAPDILWQPVENVRRITLPSEIDHIAAISEEVYQEDKEHIGIMLKADMLSIPQYLSIYLATVDDTPAAGAWIYFHPDRQFADLFGGATLPKFRKRGLYTALVAARVQEASRRGYRFLTVDASPMSRPILEKLGFRVLLYSQPFVWEPK